MRFFWNIFFLGVDFGARIVEQGAWTAHCPPFLITAAEQEEMDEAIRRGQRPPPGTQRLIPFPLPRPPVLPRHLDKVILNQRVVPSTTSSTSRTDHSPTGSSRSRVAAAGFVSPLTSAALPGGGGVPGGLGVGMGLLGGPGTTPVVDLDAPRRRERSNSRRGVLGPDGLTSPIGDDNSVLPMPSHSVVNHLATSAIRNGVLAVGTTTRYKAKVRPHFPPGDFSKKIWWDLLDKVADMCVCSTFRRFVIDQQGRVHHRRNKRVSMELGVRRLEMEICCRTKCQSLLEGRSSFIPFSLPSPNP